MIAEKTVNPVLTTRYVLATMVLTIRSSAMAKNSSIEGSDGDSLSEKLLEATWLWDILNGEPFRRRPAWALRFAVSAMSMFFASKSTEDWTRSAPAAMSGLQTNGRGSGRWKPPSPIR